VYTGDKLWNDSFVVTMCSVGLNGRVVSLPVYTRRQKIELIAVLADITEKGTLEAKVEALAMPVKYKTLFGDN
jgi:hypothetical protein